MQTKVMPRRVAEAMTVRPITIRPETPVGELFALFELHDFNALPVVDAQGVLLGMVTKLDLLRLFHSPETERWGRPRGTAGDRVEDFMTRGLISVEPDDSVAAAIDLMVDYRLRILPVIERRQFQRYLVGVVSRSDLLRWVEVQ